MYCEVCGGTGGLHKHACPEGHTFTDKPKEICCECREGIYVDDEYVENLDGELMHLECCDSLRIRELLKWIGFEVERMKDYD